MAETEITATAEFKATKNVVFMKREGECEVWPRSNVPEEIEAVLGL